jgi:hypothetical protein
MAVLLPISREQKPILKNQQSEAAADANTPISPNQQSEAADANAPVTPILM